VTAIPGIGRVSIRRYDSVASALLIAALLVASAVLVFNFSSFKSPSTGPPPNPPSVPPPNGSLLIKIQVEPESTSMETSSVRTQGTQNFTQPQLSPVNFTIVAKNSGYPTASISVPQPGQAEVARPEGIYLVSASSEYYSFSEQVFVSPNTVSELDVNVSQSLIRPSFVQVGDPDRTGVVEPWQTLVIQSIGTSRSPIQGEPVFLEAVPSSSINGSCAVGGPCVYYVASGPVEVTSGPIVVRAVTLQADLRPNGLWLLLQPEQPLALGTGSLYIYSVGETHLVTYLG